MSTALTATLATLSACNAGDFTYRPRDAASDTAVDAVVDARADAAGDVAADVPGTDAPRDVAADMAADVALDVAADVMADAPADLPLADVPRDATADVVTDAPPVCPSPTILCASACVNPATTLAHCGGCGVACPAVTNGTAACVAGACRPTCATGFAVSGTACVAVTVPRAISPLSTSNLTVATPTLRWALRGPADSVHVDISRDRNFAVASSDASSDVTTGTSFTPTTALSTGVHYWRMSQTVGGVVSAFSPTWEFVVPRVPAPRANLRGFLNDVNRDGLADLLVRGPGGNAVYVFHGTTGELGATPTRVLTQTTGQFSNGLGFVGDVNGDGFGDVVVGSFVVNDVRVYLGTAAGLSATADVLIPNPGVPSASTGFGWQVSGLGDTNGDGYGDVLISANGNNPRAYVFNGSATGLPASPSVSLPAPGADPTGFGSGATGLGDLNGDGFNDLAISEPTGGMGGNGLVHLYLGGATGIPATATQSIGGPMTTGVTGFGAALAGMTDVQNDGYNDLVLTMFAQQPGLMFLFRGAPGMTIGMMPSTMPTMGGGTGENWGARIASGDVNNDGFDDVLVSNTLVSSRRGSTTIYLGSAVGFSGSLPYPSPDTGTAMILFGVGRVAGDLNGDGLPDLVVGAPGVSPGRVYIFRQTGTGVPATHTQIITNSGSDFGVGFAQ